MAYPVNAPTLSDIQSIDVIMEAEASIVQCMASLFCNTLVGDIVNLRAELELGVEEQISLLKTIMCGYTAKENAIASVIAASAKKSAVDAGINPCDLCCCFGCNE